MDTEFVLLYRFEFDEGYFINSICLYAKSYEDAIKQLTLILGDAILDYVQSIHRIY